jgi:isopropylmalate/homocitrate/citramalate synthase
MGKNKIYLIDVTNRDGVQTSRLGLAKLEKTLVNMYLNDMGVYQSELGFPATRHETNYINGNLELAEMGVLKPIILSGWARATRGDVEEALRLTKIKHLNISISTSDQMIKSKFRGKKTRKDILDMMVEALVFAKKKGVKTVGVNAEDASRTSDKYLTEFSLAAKEGGADRIRYCDTLGCDDPQTVYTRIRRLAERVKIGIELHCHNDLGLAVACSVMGAKGAVDGGVDAYINVSVNGMGERAGNADLVSTILALKKANGFRGKYHLEGHVDLSKAWEISKYASYAFKVPIPINQPGVGGNIFSHSSGIHADGVLKDRRNYELYDFDELGRKQYEIVETGSEIVVGEYSGIKGFRNVYSKLKLKFDSDEEAAKILELVRYANVHTQKPLTDSELFFIAKYPEIARKIMTVTP